MTLAVFKEQFDLIVVLWDGEGRNSLHLTDEKID